MTIVLQPVQWNFQIADVVIFRRRQMGGTNIHLNRGQDQLGHARFRIPVVAELNKLFLRDAIMNLYISFTLLRNRCLPCILIPAR